MRLALIVALTGLASTAQAEEEAPLWAVGEGSRLEFSIDASGETVQAQFQEFDAEIQFSPDALAAARFLVVVDVESVDTGDPSRDELLVSAEFFETFRWPEARFEAEEFRHVEGDRFEALGQLTMRDQTHPLTLPFSFSAEGSSAELAGDVEISRLRYGVGQGDWESTDWVAEEARVSFQLKLTQT